MENTDFRTLLEKWRYVLENEDTIKRVAIQLESEQKKIAEVQPLDGLDDLFQIK